VDDDEMRHALVTLRYSEQMAVAKQLTREEALEQFLRTYLAQAVYALPTVLAKHLDLSEAELRAGLGRLVSADLVTSVTFPEQKGAYYAWKET